MSAKLPFPSIFGSGESEMRGVRWLQALATSVLAKIATGWHGTAIGQLLEDSDVDKQEHDVDKSGRMLPKIVSRWGEEKLLIKSRWQTNCGSWQESLSQFLVGVAIRQKPHGTNGAKEIERNREKLESNNKH
eukprot:TRINITY_DN18019_c0_g1_i2.p2 TRINITY_DN18019_c0_g1~~TRINITY_DN18019_c0_g1_i2.p2  ORF type:complete len:132 (+),score=13.28 TRINITY_DN18019_c0_g1_i2:353-748(+)